MRFLSVCVLISKPVVRHLSKITNLPYQNSFFIGKYCTGMLLSCYHEIFVCHIILVATRMITDLIIDLLNRLLNYIYYSEAVKRPWQSPPRPNGICRHLHECEWWGITCQRLYFLCYLSRTPPCYRHSCLARSVACT